MDSDVSGEAAPGSTHVDDVKPPADAAGEKKVESKRKRRGKVPKGERTPVKRPARERKAVERYTDKSPFNVSGKKPVSIVQGSGMKLKDIPNVSFKLLKRKADESLQSLHAIMFGRKSNAHFLKRNISQFSGFVWADNAEKQRAKIKEKLDKFNKEKLVDFCDILDIQINKTLAKKEEISTKLLDFLESPHATREVVLADKETGKKRGRSKGATTGEAVTKKQRSDKTPLEHDETDDDDDGGTGPADVDSEGTNEDAENKNDFAESDEENETESPQPSKHKKGRDAEPSRKTQHAIEEKDKSSKKVSAKSKQGNSASKEAEPVVESEDGKTGLGKTSKRIAKSSLKEPEVSKKSDRGMTRTKSHKLEKEDTANSSNKGRISNESSKVDENKSIKKRGKAKKAGETSREPTREDLKTVVTEILKKVDFNKVTLSDILRQVEAHFSTDLVHRKVEVRAVIEEVITSMTDDDEEEEEEEDEDEEEEDDKEEDGKSKDEAPDDDANREEASESDDAGGSEDGQDKDDDDSEDDDEKAGKSDDE